MRTNSISSREFASLSIIRVGRNTADRTVSVGRDDGVLFITLSLIDWLPLARPESVEK
jgi:hypothetical protein